MSEVRSILAAGCFWGVQELFRSYDGVLRTRVGYSGGDVKNATYRNHGTHAEAVEIFFDPDRIGFRQILEFFFQIHDPTTKNRQGNDRGLSYRSAIYYLGVEQKHVAEETIADVDASGLWGGKVVTEVEPAGMRMALKRFLAGSYSIEERMRLAATIRRSDGEMLHIDALNEVVVEKAHPGRTVRLDVDLDGRPFTSYVADGLILATPTGSTAYSFSVRGPIVDPRHRAVVLTPAAAHMLFDRSLVLRPDCEVSVTVAGDREASVCVDGRTVTLLGPGDRVRCSEGSPPARLVTFGTRDFHSVLRSKFGLTTR